jgi:hypothetical protein
MKHGVLSVPLKYTLVSSASGKLTYNEVTHVHKSKPKLGLWFSGRALTSMHDALDSIQYWKKQTTT